MGAVNPLAVKHTVVDGTAEPRTHPTFYPLIEQWEKHTQAIQRLRIGEAFIRLPDDTVRKVKTPTLPSVTVPAEKLREVKDHYLYQFFRPMPSLSLDAPRNI